MDAQVILVHPNQSDKNVSSTGQALAGANSIQASVLIAKIPFPNTIKYIFVFKKESAIGTWFRLKNIVLTEASIAHQKGCLPVHVGVCLRKSRFLPGSG